MAKPFKLRYVNEIAGTFVLLILALVVAAIVTTARSQRWFARSQTITLILPEEGSLGLKRDADVLVLGTVVGSVDSILVGDDGRMRAQVRVRSDFMRFVRSDSSAVIRKTLGIGDAYVEISRGTGAPLPAYAAAIPVSADRAPTRMMEETLEEIRTEVIPALKQFRTTFAEYQRFAADLRDPSGNLQQAFGHLNRVAAGVEQGNGLAGKLLTDPKFAQQMEQALARANESLDQMQAVLADARKTTATLPGMAASADENLKQLPGLLAKTQETLASAQDVLKDVKRTSAEMPETVGSFRQAVTALPGLILQTQQTLRETQRLVEAAQNSWLVGSPNTPQRPAHIEPDAVDAGKGAR